MIGETLRNRIVDVFSGDDGKHIVRNPWEWKTDANTAFDEHGDDGVVYTFAQMDPHDEDLSFVHANRAKRGKYTHVRIIFEDEMSDRVVSKEHVWSDNVLMWSLTREYTVNEDTGNVEAEIRQSFSGFDPYMMAVHDTMVDFDQLEAVGEKLEEMEQYVV